MPHIRQSISYLIELSLVLRMKNLRFTRAVRPPTVAQPIKAGLRVSPRTKPT